MTSTPTLSTNSLEAWRSAVAFWSTVALAPSRVAQAQARLTWRLWQSASPWPVARPAAPHVPHGALAHASASAIAAATAESVAAAPTPELAETLPQEVVAPPEAALERVEEAPAPAVTATEAADLVEEAVETLLAAAAAPAPRGSARGHRPRKG